MEIALPSLDTVLGIALSPTDRRFNMKLFLDIGKSQQELILAIILACPIVSMLLLLGLGLSKFQY